MAADPVDVALAKLEEAMVLINQAWSAWNQQDIAAIKDTVQRRMGWIYTQVAAQDRAAWEDRAAPDPPEEASATPQSPSVAYWSSFFDALALAIPSWFVSVAEAVTGENLRPRKPSQTVPIEMETLREALKAVDTHTSSNPILHSDLRAKALFAARRVVQAYDDSLR